MQYTNALGHSLIVDADDLHTEHLRVCIAPSTDPYDWYCNRCYCKHRLPSWFLGPCNPPGTVLALVGAQAAWMRNFRCWFCNASFAESFRSYQGKDKRNV